MPKIVLNGPGIDAFFGQVITTDMFQLMRMYRKLHFGFATSSLNGVIVRFLVRGHYSISNRRFNRDNPAKVWNSISTRKPRFTAP